MSLKVRYFGETGNIPFYYRPDSSDERALLEVVDKHAYARKSIRFDVEQGERWLDLGANIGSFCLYCRLQGATCESYEPEAINFGLLKKNVFGWKGFNIRQGCISADKAPTVSFWPRNDIRPRF